MKFRDYLLESETVQPKTKEELRAVIDNTIRENGNNCSLNFIDVTRVTDMSKLFYNMKKFNGNISKWDVSRVTDMSEMFSGAESFNQNISKWNVSNVKNFSRMFYDAKSFNQNLEKWNVSDDAIMQDYLFKNSPLDRKQPGWYKNRTEEDL